MPLVGGAPAADLAPPVRLRPALGEAFQLRDDLLGVFGDPSTTGKPAGDDLREGKRTVLVALALDRADADQAALFEKLFGQPDLDADGVAQLRGVIADTGAVEQVEAMIAELAASRGPRWRRRRRWTARRWRSSGRSWPRRRPAPPDRPPRRSHGSVSRPSPPPRGQLLLSSVAFDDRSWPLGGWKPGQAARLAGA